MDKGKQTETKKHADFVGGPMLDKPCTALPGIGPDHGKELSARGYSKASHILSLFNSPRVDKDEKKFQREMLKLCTINARNVALVYHALKVWTDSNQ